MRRYRVSETEVNGLGGRCWKVRRQREGGRQANRGDLERQTGQQGRADKIQSQVGQVIREKNTTVGRVFVLVLGFL